MFLFKIKQLLLLSPILWVPTLASVGFEFELPEFLVYSTKNPASIIPKRTQLAPYLEKFWSMTADESDGKNDLEVVTVPFSKFDNSDGTQKILTASKDIKDYLLSLFQAGQLSQSQNKQHVDFPRLTEGNNYGLTYSATLSKGNEGRVAPQVTFGILPSHFYQLSCGFLFESVEFDFEFFKYIIPTKNRRYQTSQCIDLVLFFQSPIFDKVPKTDDSTLLSFLTLFWQYVTIKSKEPLPYPKIVAGMFLSRVSFAEMFHQLPQEIKKIIIDLDLLREIVRSVRNELERKMVFPYGYRSTGSPDAAKGPTMEAWIEGFTRQDNPVDLLAQLDEDQSMGQMPLDNLPTTEGGELQKHWILELRGLPELPVNDIPEFMEWSFHFFSNLNGKSVPF